MVTPAARLSTVVARLCLNTLMSARARREQYVGQWLPEPVLTGVGRGAGGHAAGGHAHPAGDRTHAASRGPHAAGGGGAGPLGPLETVEQRESVPLALLVLLERLTPPERAVFVLREAFGCPHREIAQVRELSEADSRQLYRRAGRTWHRAREAEAAREARGGRTGGAAADHPHRLVETFVTAARGGPRRRPGTAGGTVGPRRRPVRGRRRKDQHRAASDPGPGAGRQVSGPGLARLAAGVDLVPYEVDGGPAPPGLAGGRLVGVVALESACGRIAALRVTANPDKLGYAARQLAARHPDDADRLRL